MYFCLWKLDASRVILLCFMCICYFSRVLETGLGIILLDFLVSLRIILWDDIRLEVEMVCLSEKDGNGNGSER